MPAKSSIKSALIVRFILSFERPVTRSQLATAIGQPRLYDHDLKLIKQLVQDRVIIEHRRRRLDVVHDRNEQARFEYNHFWNRSIKEAQRYRWGMMGWVYEYEIHPLYLGKLQRQSEAAVQNQPGLLDRLKSWLGL